MLQFSKRECHKSTGFNMIIAERTTIMLYIIATVLIVLWLLGLITSYTMGGFVHLLLVIAVVVVLMRIITGRRIT